MRCEIKIGLKNGSKSLIKKTIVSEHFAASWNDPIIDGLLAESLREFDDVPKKTLVMIKLIGNDE